MASSTLWDLAQELRDVLPLHVLSDAEGHELYSHMHLRRFDEGETVYHRGDPAADTFVVHRGLVKSLLQDENGRDLLVGLYGRGEFFGTLTLFQNGTRESTVVAVVPTTVMQIARADALRVLEGNARAMHFMFERLAGTIRQLSGMLEGIVFLDAPGRLARYLVELRRLDGLPLTQDDIASAIGSTRETVNKTLKDFEKRGLVKVERRRVHVIDQEGLRREVRI
jgi:CRP/FNR family transcriptional regulator/CRP/FNR family cyclic AMP-dependent transcriptional regulator